MLHGLRATGLLRRSRWPRPAQPRAVAPLSAGAASGCGRAGCGRAGGGRAGGGRGGGGCQGPCGTSRGGSLGGGRALGGPRAPGWASWAGSQAQQLRASSTKPQAGSCSQGPAPGGEWAALLSLRRYVLPEGMPEARRRVAMAAALMVASKLLSLQVPLLLRSVIDSVSPAAAVGAAGLAELATVPLAVVLSYGAVRVGASLCSELRNMAFAAVSARANTTLSLHIFEHLHELSLQYHLSRQTGALATTVDRGKRGMQWLLSVVIFNVAPTILEVALVSGLLGYSLGPRFAAVTLSTIGMYTVWTCAVATWRAQIRREMNEAESAAGALLVDSLVNYETVKIFGAERAESRRYGTKLDDFEGGQRKSSASLAMLNFGQQLIFTMGMTTMLLMCAEGVVAQSMTVGDLVMANGFLLQLSQPLGWLGTMYSESKRSLVDFQAMISVFEDRPMQPTASPGAAPLFRGPSSATEPLSVAFDSVTFRYPTASHHDPPLLRGVSLSVPPGASLGIVGHSGSGKSSLLRLLFRFYDPQEGSILVGGRDIRDIDLASLRRAIAIIPQDVVLLNGTLYENLLYGNPSADAAEVQAAIRGAALDSVAEALPLGLDTLVGERGLKLSGGEKQRVAIARALLKRPAILLVDEGTSSLDSATECQVLDQLRASSQDRGCTTIMIAHRLSTLQAAEQICVLRGGLITEVGSHAELLRRGGEYRSMWAQQHSSPPGG